MDTRKRKRNSGGNNEADWTAARCQRLLRPLSSRIAPLRKLIYITNSSRQEETNISKTRAGCATGRQSGERDRCLEDPTWLRRSDARSGLKKYSSKERAKSSTATAGKEVGDTPERNVISLPTPFRARALRRNTSAKKANEETGSTPCAKAQIKVPKRQKKDPFSFAPVARQSIELHDRQTFEKVFELNQGVVDGYSLLLQKTEPPESSRGKQTGACSLFSMCLRKVPDYIQAEGTWRKSLDPDDETDVCAEVYEELEEFGSMSNRGWPPLREIVRAHGFKLVQDIIREKLVSTKARAELANMPLLYDERLDSEKLVLAMAGSLVLKRPFNAAAPLFEGCLASLEDTALFCRESGSLDTRIRVLTDLFGSKRLHASWLATKDMSRMLSDAVRSLASGNGSADVSHIINFLEQIVMQALNTRQTTRPPPSVGAAESGGLKEESTKIIPASQSLSEAIYKTIDSLITVLTTMSIIFTRRDDHETSNRQNLSRRAVNLLQSLATSILVRCHDQHRKQEDGESTSSTRIKLSIVASALITKIEADKRKSDVKLIGTNDLISGINIISQQHSDLHRTVTEKISSFVCNLALCCGQSLSFDAQDMLEDLVENLITHAETATVEATSFLHQLALESALGFAALVPSRKGKLFANKMEQTMGQSGPIVSKNLNQDQTAKTTGARGGFRWEEGLCEWIAATPFSSRKGRFSGNVDPPTWSLPVFATVHDDRTKISLQEQSVFGSDAEPDLDDSGYCSAKETPQAKRRKSAGLSMLLSSPDVLALGHSSPRRVSRNQDLLLTRNESKHLVEADGNEKKKVRSNGLAIRKSRTMSRKSTPFEDSASNTTLPPKVSRSHIEDKQPQRAKKKAERTPENGDILERNPRGKEVEIVQPPNKTIMINIPPRIAASELKKDKSVADNVSDDDLDELAICCTKKPSRLSHANPKGRSTSTALRKIAPIKGRKARNLEPRKRILDESEDELA